MSSSSPDRAPRSGRWYAVLLIESIVFVGLTGLSLFTAQRLTGSTLTFALVLLVLLLATTVVTRLVGRALSRYLRAER